MNVAAVAPAATDTDAGTVNKVLLLVSITVAPPAGAVWLRLTVQVADAPLPRRVGAHDREDVPGTEMTALVGVETLMVFPLASTAIRFDSATEVVPAAGARVRFKYAAMPEATVFAFSPSIRQVEEPGTETQVNDLPAALAEGPAVSDTDEN